MAKPNYAKERPCQNSKMVSFFLFNLCFQCIWVASFICLLFIGEWPGGFKMHVSILVDSSACYNWARNFVCAHHAIESMLVGCWRKRRIPGGKHLTAVVIFLGLACCWRKAFSFMASEDWTCLDSFQVFFLDYYYWSWISIYCLVSFFFFFLEDRIFLLVFVNCCLSVELLRRDNSAWGQYWRRKHLVFLVLNFPALIIPSCHDRSEYVKHLIYKRAK